jgi:CRP-like cAMP-binding protein
MQALYQHSQRFEKFGRLIAENLFIKTARSKRNLMVQSAEDRYLDLLTSQPHILERLPQHLIASYLGIQPQSLSRIRARIANAKS